MLAELRNRLSVCRGTVVSHRRERVGNAIQRRTFGPVTHEFQCPPCTAAAEGHNELDESDVV